MTHAATFRGPAVSEEAFGREAWIDNLRVAIIVGVIGSHVALIYAIEVGWYYEERTAGEVAKAVLAGVFSPGLLFGMGLLFFVAGFFTPPDRVAKTTTSGESLRRLGGVAAALEATFLSVGIVGLIVSSPVLQPSRCPGSFGPRSLDGRYRGSSWPGR